MRYSVIVDGPNFISRLIGFGFDCDKIANGISLNNFLINGIRPHFQNEFSMGVISIGLEFIYSKKLPGPKGNKLNADQWKQFLSRSSKQNAVYLNLIDISSSHEKGVDVAVATRLIEVAENCEIICLVSSDNDYIPVLEYLKKKGKYVCTAGFDDSHSVELKNLSYLFIDLHGYFQALVSADIIQKIKDEKAEQGN